MYPTYVLQEFWQGDWHEIGWRASTPKSHADLEKHGQRLADSGCLVQLVALSPRINGEPTVVTTFLVPAR